MNYLKNALQNNQKNDDFFDFTTTKKSHTIKMPIGKTGRSFDVEIDDEVLGEFFKKQQYKTTAENLSTKQTINGADTNEFTDIFSLPKAEYDALFAPQNIGQSQRQNAVNKVQQDEPTDIFSLPKAEYDALFAPQKPAVQQGIYQNNRQTAQQNSMSNYAVNINPNMGQSLQANTQKAIGNNNITPDTVYPDRELIYQNPLLKQAQNTTLNESQASTYQNYLLSEADDAVLETKPRKGYPTKLNKPQSKKEGKKRILIITGEGINSKKENGEREDAWEAIRKEFELYPELEIDMPQELSFYDYDSNAVSNFAEVLFKGKNPRKDKDAISNAQAVSNYVKNKIGNEDLSDYYDGIYFVGYSGGGETADATATNMQELYGIPVDRIIKIGSPYFRKRGEDEYLDKKTIEIGVTKDWINRVFNQSKGNDTYYINIDDEIDQDYVSDAHKSYFATPQAMQAIAREIAKLIGRDYTLNGGTGKYAQTDTFL